MAVGPDAGIGPHEAHGGRPFDPRGHRSSPPVPPAPPALFGAPGFGAAQRHGPRVKRGDVRAAILTLLAERPRNGYQIIQEIAERSRGIWKPSPGSVYPALQQLEDEGLVSADNEGGRRTYGLTAQGSAHVAAHCDQHRAPWAAVAGSVTDEMVDVRMLMAQVAMALQQVAQAGSADQLAEAGEVLADTKRALYRILAEDTPRRRRARAHDNPDDAAGVEDVESDHADMDDMDERE